jgi:cytochrome bd-type quinol oxidase subunit 2
LDSPKKDFYWLWHYSLIDGFDLGLGFYQSVAVGPSQRRHPEGKL